MTIRLYGIPNCDTVKKARLFLAQREIACDFVDFKKQGVPAAALAVWVAALGWEPLLNRRGTTWRALDPATQATVTDAASAMRLMQQHPSVIKRPVAEWPDASVSVGFAADAWGQRLGGCGGHTA